MSNNTALAQRLHKSHWQRQLRAPILEAIPKSMSRQHWLCSIHSTLSGFTCTRQRQAINLRTNFARNNGMCMQMHMHVIGGSLAEAACAYAQERVLHGSTIAGTAARSTCALAQAVHQGTQRNTATMHI
jgi:hypothetical protein